LTFLKNISSGPASDEELVKAYKQSRDKEILASLYQRYMDLVYGVCIKYLGDPDYAKDAVMNIFEELVTKLMKYEVDYFKGWIFTVAKTHCLMKIRASSKFRTLTIDPSLMQSEEEMHLNGVFENESRLDQLSKCMQGLSPDQKEVVDLFYLQQKCYKEISAMTGQDWNKVRSLIQNGRRNLKICMEKSTSMRSHE
jgi:RNA polymerase sigma-70 factor (ECF subfamily)